MKLKWDETLKKQQTKQKTNLDGYNFGVRTRLRGVLAHLLHYHRYHHASPLKPNEKIKINNNKQKLTISMQKQKQNIKLDIRTNKLIQKGKKSDPISNQGIFYCHG